jgi:hypothetical protein
VTSKWALILLAIGIAGFAVGAFAAAHHAPWLLFVWLAFGMGFWLTVVSRPTHRQ